MRRRLGASGSGRVLATATATPLEVPVLKSIIAWIVLIIILLWVINNPDHAADLLHKAGNALDSLDR